MRPCQSILNSNSFSQCGFSVTTVQGQRFLTVEVDNPTKYVQRANVLKRFVVSMNANYFGGPIQISANSLKINFDELQRVANAFFEKHRPGSSDPKGSG